MSTWTEVIKHLKQDEVKALEREVLGNPILYAALLGSSELNPVTALVLACVALSKHNARLVELATEKIKLTPTRPFFIP